MSVEQGEGMSGFLWRVGKFCFEVSPSLWMCAGLHRNVGCRPPGPNVDQVGDDDEHEAVERHRHILGFRRQPTWLLPLCDCTSCP